MAVVSRKSLLKQNAKLRRDLRKNLFKHSRIVSKNRLKIRGYAAKVQQLDKRVRQLRFDAKVIGALSFVIGSFMGFSASFLIL